MEQGKTAQARKVQRLNRCGPKAGQQAHRSRQGVRWVGGLYEGRLNNAVDSQRCEKAHKEGRYAGKAERLGENSQSGAAQGRKRGKCNTSGERGDKKDRLMGQVLGVSSRGGHFTNPRLKKGKKRGKKKKTQKTKKA